MQQGTRLEERLLYFKIGERLCVVRNGNKCMNFCRPVGRWLVAQYLDITWPTTAFYRPGLYNGEMAGLFVKYKCLFHRWKQYFIHYVARTSWGWLGGDAKENFEALLYPTL